MSCQEPIPKVKMKTFECNDNDLNEQSSCVSVSERRSMIEDVLCPPTRNAGSSVEKQNVEKDSASIQNISDSAIAQNVSVEKQNVEKDSASTQNTHVKNVSNVAQDENVNAVSVHINALIQECEVLKQNLNKMSMDILEPEHVNVIKRDSKIPPMCRVVTIVNGVYIESLIDTGCYSVLIKTNTLRDMWKSQAFTGEKILRKCVGNTGVTANGSTIQLLYTTYLQIEIGGRLIGVDAWVCETLSENLILGKNFLDLLSPIYYVSHGIEVENDKKRVFVPFLGNDTKHSDLNMHFNAKETCNLEPGQSKIVQVKMNVNVNILNGLNLMLSPHPGWIEKRILIEHSLVNNFGPYFVSVLNCTDEKFTLHENEPVGRADWVSGKPTCVNRVRGNKIKKCMYTPDSDREFNTCVHECKSLNVKKPLQMQKVMTFTQVTLADRHKFLDENLNLDKDASWLSEDQKQQLRDIIYKYADIVSTGQMDIGRTTLAEHEIDTGDHPPISQKPYRVEHSLREVIEEHVKKMLEIDLIEPSKSPWSSPVVVITKPDGEKRFCIDYRKINKITIRDTFPLPRIDDIIPMIGKNRYFIGLDLASGYWQVPMSQKYDSINKTTFVCHMGTYRFKYMPFGGINCPATFQRLMNVCLSGLLDKICFVYLDDILIVGKSYEEAMNNLKIVFDRLRKANLKIKLKKCEFAKRSIKYLGHIIGENGIQVNPKKIEAINNLAIPKSAKDVKSALGMMTFYAKFIPHYSDLVKPLHEAGKKLRSEEFMWTDECQKNWEKIKEILSSDVVLAYPDRTKEFNLYCDASSIAIGAVLTQFNDHKEERPIGFFSRMFKPNEQKWNNTERETTAVIWSLENFRPYLYGGKCTVYTDNNACIWLAKRAAPSRNVAVFQFHMLGEVDWECKYIPGPQNKTADFLSRFPTKMDCHKKEENVNALIPNEENVNDIPSGMKYSSKKIIGGHVECENLHGCIRKAYDQNLQTFAFDVSQKATGQLKPVDMDAWKIMMKKFKFNPEHIMPHAYLKMNTGTINDVKLKACQRHIIKEMKYVDKLGLKKYVLHPGSAINQISKEECMERIAETINVVLEKTQNVVILVENMSGGGNLVGNTFEELAYILQHVGNKSRVGICLDTCHAFAKGYDLDTIHGYNEMMENLDKAVGLKFLKGIHLNDSKEAKGLKHDRHEVIGKGKISFQVFHAMMKDERLDGIPMILETPSVCYKKEIQVLYDLEKGFLSNAMECNAVTRQVTKDLDEFEQRLILEQNADAECQFMMTYLKDPESFHKKDKYGKVHVKVNNYKRRMWAEKQSKYYFIDEDGLLKRVDPNDEDIVQTIVPRSLVKIVLENFHGVPMSGHPGINAMMANVKRSFYWKFMDVDIIRKCQNCEKCIEFKKNVRYKAPLKPYLPTTIFEMVNTDICGPFNESNDGNKYIIGFIDQLSRFAITEAIPDQKAETVAKVYVDKVCFMFGPAVKLLSDQGKPYVSKLLKEIANLVNTIKIESTTYHPQTNGLIERFWRKLKEDIGMFCTDPEMKDWDEGLQAITYAYNTSVKSGLGKSPMEILTGNKPRMPLEFFKLPKKKDLKEANEFLSKRVHLLRRIQKDICQVTAKERQKQKELYDKKTKPHSFQNGDLVYKLVEVPMPGKPQKLQQKYEGPHRIVHLTATNAVIQVDCNPDVTEIIHLNKLKRGSTDASY